MCVAFVLAPPKATSTEFPLPEPMAGIPTSYDNALIFYSGVRILTMHGFDPRNGISHGTEILSYSLDAARWNASLPVNCEL